MDPELLSHIIHTNTNYVKYANQIKLSTAKILRKIKKSRKKGWYHYLLDTLVVIVGILSAFALNNWKEARNEKAEEQRILKIIEAEFIYNQEELDRNITKASKLNERADSISKLFYLSKSELDTINTDLLIRGLTAYSSFDPSNGAVNDLIGSGRLGIIRNDSLRLRLSKWSGEVQDVKEDEMRLMDFGNTYLIPKRLSNISPSHSKFKLDSKKLFNDPEFENINWHIKSSTGYIINTNYKMLDVEIKSILNLLEQEIN